MKQKALIVGINKYKNFPDKNLKGCVNDTLTISQLLIDLKGFKKEDIIILTNEKATKKNILGNLKSIINNNERIVFSLSSHGAQIKNFSGKDANKVNDAFCPYDSAVVNNKVDPNHIILDDELHDLFHKVSANVEFEVFLDTCHSGEGLRVSNLSINKIDRFLNIGLEIQGINKKDINKKRTLSNSSTHFLWSGCMADQTSADTYIHNKWQGAFTCYYNKVIRNCNNSSTNIQILNKIRTELKEAGYSQIPQLEYNPAQ